MKTYLHRSGAHVAVANYKGRKMVCEGRTREEARAEMIRMMQEQIKRRG